MTLTDEPTTRHDPRLITATVTTTDYTTWQSTSDTVVLSVSSADLDPEFRNPVFWMDLMLDSDKGREVRETWRRFRDDDVHPEAYNVVVWCDGEYLMDEGGCDAAASWDIAVARAERKVVNP